MKNLIKDLHLPTVPKKQLTAYYREWQRDYKDDMTFVDYLSSVGIAPSVIASLNLSH